MSMRLHRSFHYDDDDYYYSYTNGDDGRSVLANRFQTSIAKSFLFFRNSAVVIFSLLFAHVHLFSSLFMLIFVSIYDLNSSIAPSNNWS